MGSAPLSFFWVVNPSRCFLSTIYLILLFPFIIVSFSPSVFLFRCVLHPLPLPLSSCLGCIPPLIGLPSLRFLCGCLQVVSNVCVFLFVFFILSRRCPLLATFLSVVFCLLSLLTSDSRFDLVWFRISCDHGWIRSGSVNVRKTTTKTTTTTCRDKLPAPIQDHLTYHPIWGQLNTLSVLR